MHPDAVVIGDVTIGPESTVWPGAVLRGDYGTITVGARTSIQDGTVVHAGPGFPTVIGDGCVVGHLAHLEGCTLDDESLVGSGVGRPGPRRRSRRGDRRRRRRGTHRMVVPEGSFALGVPAKILEGRSDVAMIRISALEHGNNAKRYRASLRRIG